ncbi:MAG: hypothetical protein R6V03_04395 [Kiritimatiellia bacterium]
MNKKTKIALTAGLAVIVAAIAVYRFTTRPEEFVEKYPEGGVKAVFQYVDRDGKRLKHGTCTEFDAAGNRIMQCGYRYGERHGTMTRWDSKGRLVSTTEFTEGKKHGEYVSYWPNGNVREEKRFRDGVPHGRYTTYWQDGTKSVEGRYREGFKAGTWIEYDKAGVELSKKEMKATEPEAMEPPSLDDYMDDGIGKD